MRSYIPFIAALCTVMGVSANPLPLDTTSVEGFFIPLFLNENGATEASSFMTFKLVDTVQECADFCRSVEGCIFFNSWHDVNGKDGSTQLTCSLFSDCQNALTATNMGGQTQEDGKVDFATNSDGYCLLV